MAKSMVSGKPLSLMLQFATPLLLGNLLQQTYNIIDAAIVGQILGDKALAGVGASSSIQFLVLGFCMGCCAGFGVPVAKYFGANNLHKMRKYIFNGAVLTGIIALIVTIVCSVCCNQILHLLSVPQDIYDKAYAYLIVCIPGNSVHTHVQLSVKCAQVSGRQQNAVHVSGVLGNTQHIP